MILLRDLQWEECSLMRSVREKEGSLRFHRGRYTRAPSVNLMGVIRKDGGGSFLTH